MHVYFIIKQTWILGSDWSIHSNKSVIFYKVWKFYDELIWHINVKDTHSKTTIDVLIVVCEILDLSNIVILKCI